MAQGEQPRRKSDGRWIAAWTAKQGQRAVKFGARKLREHRAKPIGKPFGPPTPKNRIAPGLPHVQYQKYQTPEQRLAAQSKPKPPPRTRTYKAKGKGVARCPICHNLQYGFHTRAQANAWIVRHVTKYHGRRT